MNKILTIALVVLGVGYYMWSKTRPEIKNLDNSGQTIVAFGDSLTEGFGVNPGSTYPNFLAKKTSWPILNLGRSGETAQDAPARLDLAINQNPYMVLIAFGGNDQMRGVPFEKTILAMEEMVLRVQRAGAIAVVVDIGGYSGMGPYSKAYEQMAKRHGAVFVPGIMDGIFTKAKYKSDSIHPNREGYALIADKIYKHIKPYLKEK